MSPPPARARARSWPLRSPVDAAGASQSPHLQSKALTVESAPQTIVSVRGRVSGLLARESSARRGRDVVLLGLDGIPHDLGVRSWPHATTSMLHSVFPTTSSTGWLSSLSGASVEEHGVPGVVFKLKETGGALVNVFDAGCQFGGRTEGNLFEDARRAGYSPVAILGDLENLDCAWRSELLRGAEWVRGFCFYDRPGEPERPDAKAICDQIRRAIRTALGGPKSGPRLVWCFVDVDRYIHRHGYDEHVREVLVGVDQIACELANDAIVIAHSDHGLTPTIHDPIVGEILQELERGLECEIGGAGRTRWIYPGPGGEARALDLLSRRLPPSIRVCRAEEHFSEGSLARSRVGEILLIAEGTAFVAPEAYRFEHGSLTDDEVAVPFSTWGA